METFTFEHFFSDLKNLLIKPKEIAKNLVDAPYNSLFLISFILTGISMGMRKLISSQEVVNLVAGKAENLPTHTVIELGQRDAALITAFLIPFALVIGWYVAAFAIDYFSEKCGGFGGSFEDTRTVLGYMGVVLLFFEIFILMLFIVGYVANFSLMNNIIAILYFIFAVYLLYIGVMCIEALYGMPMSYSGMVFIGVMLSMLCSYYLSSLILEKFILPELLKGKYAI